MQSKTAAISSLNSDTGKVTGNHTVPLFQLIAPNDGRTHPVPITPAKRRWQQDIGDRMECKATVEEDQELCFENYQKMQSKTAAISSLNSDTGKVTGNH